MVDAMEAMDDTYQEECHDQHVSMNTVDKNMEYEQEFESFIENMNLLYYKRIEPKTENPFAHYKKHYAMQKETETT